MAKRGYTGSDSGGSRGAGGNGKDGRRADAGGSRRGADRPGSRHTEADSPYRRTDRYGHGRGSRQQGPSSSYPESDFSSTYRRTDRYSGRKAARRARRSGRSENPGDARRAARDYPGGARRRDGEADRGKRSRRSGEAEKDVERIRQARSAEEERIRQARSVEEGAERPARSPAAEQSAPRSDRSSAAEQSAQGARQGQPAARQDEAAVREGQPEANGAQQRTIRKIRTGVSGTSGGYIVPPPGSIQAGPARPAGIPGNAALRAQPAEDERRGRRRRQARFIMMIGIFVSVLAFLGVFWAVRFRTTGTAPAAEPPLAGDEQGSNAVFMAKDEGGRLSQVFVAVRSDQGLSIYTIPPRTLLETPDSGFQRVDEMLQSGGQQMLDQALADLLQVPIRYHVTFDYDAAQAIAEEAGTINFHADRALATADGSVSLSAGDNPAGAQRAISYLKASVNDGTAGPQIQALFYRGLEQALSGKPELDRRNFAKQLQKKVTTDMGDDFIDLFADMTAPSQSNSVWPLPVKMTGSGTTWYLEPDSGQLQVLMSGSPLDSGFTLEIRNGTEEAGVVEAAGDRLSALRYNTSLVTAPSGVNFDSTQIRCGVDALEQGNHVEALLGKGTIIKDEYMEKRQIIVIIGRDLTLADLQKH